MTVGRSDGRNRWWAASSSARRVGSGGFNACGLVCVGLVVVTGGCTAQRPRREGVRTLRLTESGGYVEFAMRQRSRDQQSRVGAGRKRSDETIMEQNLKLETRGYVYHPNLLDFSLSGLFGLLQHDFEDEFGGRKRTSGDDGTVLEFDFSGSFLTKKRYPGTVFARRYRALEPRPFQSSIETTTNAYGLTWQFVSDKTPTSVQFTHTEVELDPLNDLEEAGSQVNTFLRFETAYRFSPQNGLSFVYSHQSVSEQPFALAYDSDELTLSHKYLFGDGHKHRLESELNYFDQTGTFNIRRVRWREILRLQHTDRLRSWYRLEWTRRDQGSLSGVAPIGERSYFLSGALEHKLYDSLVTQLLLFAQQQDFDPDLEITRHGIQASADYRKKNRWGVLLANYRVRFQTEDHQGGTQRAEILDERHTFRDPEPVVLANTRVEPGSLMVTSDDGLTIYRQGADYTLRLVGDRTELERVPTGRILDGQAILVDYVRDLGGSFKLDTLMQDVSIRQRFDFGLSPYYRFRRQDQTLSPTGATGVTPEDINAHIVGVEFERAALRLAAEFEDHQSTVNPFEAVRLRARYRHRLASGGTATIGARWTDVDRAPPNRRRTRFFSIEGRYRHPVTDHLTVEGALLYRNEHDSITGSDEGVDVDVSLEWHVRQTDVRLTYEWGRFDDAFAENQYSALFLQVKRSF